MLAQLGHTLIWLAMGAAAFNIAATGLATRRSNRAAWLESAHNAVFVCWAFVAAACALLIAAFLTDNFALSYVWQNSNRDQPVPFKISALWGGQGGSLLLWTFVLATYALVISRSGRKSGQNLAPAAVAVVTATTFFFAALVFFRENPFALVEGAVPADGRGMNPLLQNYWMQIHPPTLYIGYVGCTVPFAFAVSALLHRRFDEEWVSIIRRWVLFTWIVLTVGIVLGGVWAYETLGWGGYWAWDPVENASLLPWLSATAFLHSIMLQGRRGLLKNWNIALVTLTFLLSIFGTFLTRSGVVQSVHSFAESGIGGYFLGFMGFALALTMVLIYLRRSELHSDAKIESSLSREGIFMLNNWLLLGATFAVLWGTVFPTLSEAIGGGRVTVGQEYFNRVMAPIGLLLLALTGIGPLLPWRRATWAGVWKAIKFPLLWSLPFVPVMWFLAQWRTGAATAFVLAVFVFLAIGWEFFRGIKTLMHKRREGAFEASANLLSFNPARYGGYIVHLGVAVMFVGLTGSSVFKIETDPIQLKKGETMRVGEYVLRYDGLARPTTMPDNLQDQLVALVTVFDQNGQITPPDRPMDPRIDIFKNTTGTDATGEEVQRARRPSIRSTPANDLYLVLDALDTKDNSASIKAYMNPLVMWIWVSMGFFVLGTVVAMLPHRRSAVAPLPVPAPVEEREKELVA
ncbi:MAG: cytochrome c biogenesis protein CcsA [Armatimonadetes bacterium]|nr:cytochrome c biogenesis protein CcsA [Armatimonadota bacterium]